MSGLEQSFSFRQWEISRLLEWVRAAESASIVGVSGVGKSNLFNHLLNPQVRHHYLGETDTNYIFVRTNFHFPPDASDRSIYSLILEQFEELELIADQYDLDAKLLKKLGRQHTALLDAGDDLLKVQRHFKLAIRLLLKDKQNHLVLLFDQFDDVYREASPRLLANLRGLREAYKYRLSFLVFTRDLLPNLAEMDAGREEFYELLASNVIGLKPYNDEDASLLLQRIAKRYQWSLEQSWIKILLELTGGHAGLLRSVYLTAVQQNISLNENKNLSAALLLHPSIKLECQKIWDSLSVEEHRVLVYCAHNTAVELERAAENSLQLKGLLDIEIEKKLFSPIFVEYVKSQEALWERPLYFDKNKRQVWVHGRPTNRLTALDYDLFKALYDNLGDLVTKDELIEAGWPGSQGGVTDDALTAAISRLRKKIEPDSDNPQFLEVMRGQGYKLKIE